MTGFETAALIAAGAAAAAGTAATVYSSMQTPKAPSLPEPPKPLSFNPTEMPDPGDVLLKQRGKRASAQQLRSGRVGTILSSAANDSNDWGL